MKALCDRFVPQQSSKSEKHDNSPTSLVSDSGSSDNNKSKFTYWSNVFAPSSSSSSVSQPYRESSSTSASTSAHKQVSAACNGWTALVKKAFMASGAIRRFQERVLGPNRTGLPSTTSDVWLLGVCYKISEDEASRETDDGSVMAALQQDFSSRILLTYRRGLCIQLQIQVQRKVLRMIFTILYYRFSTHWRHDIYQRCKLGLHDSEQPDAFCSGVRKSIFFWREVLKFVTCFNEQKYLQALLFHRLGRSWRSKKSEVSSM